MRKLPLLLGSIAALGTLALVAKAQVPGINSTLNTVFTFAYDQSTMKATYSAAGAVNLGTTATQVCVLQGSATRNIRVRRVFISGEATAVVTDPVTIRKQSTTPSAASGASIITSTAYDSGQSAATAIMDVYSATGGTSPTVTSGTLVGLLADILVTFNNFTTGTGSGTITHNFGQLGSPVVLRSAAENIAVSLDGSSPGGGVFNCTFEWTEEAPGNG